MKKIQNAEAPAFEPPFIVVMVNSYIRFINTSPMLAELTGYSTDELSCMGAQEIVALESVEAALESVEKAEQHGWSQHVTTIFCKDGTPVSACVDTFRLAEDRYLACLRKVDSPGNLALPRTGLEAMQSSIPVPSVA